MLNWLKEKLKKKYRDHQCLYCKTLLMRHWTELSIKTKVKGEKGVKHIISLTCPKCGRVNNVN